MNFKPANVTFSDWTKTQSISSRWLIVCKSGDAFLRLNDNPHKYKMKIVLSSFKTFTYIQKKNHSNCWKLSLFKVHFNKDSFTVQCCTKGSKVGAKVAFKSQSSIFSNVFLSKIHISDFEISLINGSFHQPPRGEPR